MGNLTGLIGPLPGRRIMAIHILLGDSLKRFAMVVAAVSMLALTGCSHEPPAPSVPDVKAKADAFSAKLQGDRDAATQAELEKLTVLLRTPASGAAARVLYAGDSITAGYATTTPDKTFREVTLAELRKQFPVTPVVAGAPGLTTGQVAPDAESGGNYDLLIVELGTNDVDKTPSIETFKSDYTALIASLRAKSPNAALVCLGPWHTPAKADPYNAIIEPTCEAAGGKFRPLSTYYNSEVNRWAKGVMPDGTKTDNFHPSDTGHSAIAKQVMSAIRFS